MGNTRLWQYRPGFLMTLAILAVRSVWRFFFTGQPLSDRADDDRPQETTLERLSGPLWHRMVLRWAALGVPIILVQIWFWALLVGSVEKSPPTWTTWPWLMITTVWLISGAVALVTYYTIQGVKIIRHWKRTNEFVYPTWQAVCNVLNLQYSRHDARKFVHLPPGFEPSDQVIEEPGQYSWISYAVGWGWVREILDARRLEREQERIAREAKEEEEIEEPVFIPEPVPAMAATTEIVPYPIQATEPGNGKTHLMITPSPEDPPVRIYLPQGKVGNSKVQANLLDQVGAVLGMPQPKATWEPRGKHPYVELRPNRPPPASVRFKDIRRHLDKVDMDHPILGLAAGGRVVTLDFVNDSPHFLYSGGAGTGKSSTIRDVIPQRMHCGAGSIFLDYKRISHRWAHGLPGSVYAWRIVDIHRVAIEVGALLEYRIENVIPEDDPYAPARRWMEVDVVVEEINSLTPQLQAYWMAVKGPQDPAQSPAVNALKRAVNMGRELRIHMHVGAQRGSASVFGSNGGDIRESFAGRLLAKYTIQTWKMLAGGIPYLRWPGGGRGVWVYVQGDEPEVIRVPFWTDEEARSWAMSGVPSPDNPLGDSGSMIETIPQPKALPEKVTLRQALERGLPGPEMLLRTLQKAAERGTGNFPAHVGTDGQARLWVYEDLVHWKLDLDARKSPIQIATPIHRPWIVYAFDTLKYPGQDGVELGYVGQSVRKLSEREDEHRGDKPWADLIVGSPRVLWSSDSCTQAELDAQEMYYIRTLKPRYNIEGQLGQPWATPKWDQISQRQDRQKIKGLGPWTPIDVYAQRHPEGMSHVVDDH